MSNNSYNESDESDDSEEFKYDPLSNDLWFAVRDDEICDAEALLVKGANPNYCKWHGSDDESTDDIMDRAFINNNLDMIKLLIKYGYNTEYIGGYYIEYLSSLEIIKYLLDNYNQRNSILGNAINIMDADITKYIIQFPFFQTEDGKESLNYALITASKKNKLDIIKILIKNRADPNTMYALYEAAKCGNFKIVKFLVENGANINIEKNNHYNQPITQAIKRNRDNHWPMIHKSKDYLNIVKFLHDNGAIIDNEHFVLLNALEAKDIDMLNLVLSFGLDLESNGLSALEMYLKFNSKNFNLNHIKRLINKCSKCKNILTLVRYFIDKYKYDAATLSKHIELETYLISLK